MEPELRRLEEKLTKEVLWLYVLSVLKKEPMHAYALRKKIHTQFGFLPGEVTAYVVLYKLEANGIVVSNEKENKKVYSITQKGKNSLKAAEKNLKEKIRKIFR